MIDNMTYECIHSLTPIKYGYMDREMIFKIDSKEIVYGGYNKPVDAANYFCFKCLEDINL